jgi:hypothetical protein
MGNDNYALPRYYWERGNQDIIAIYDRRNGCADAYTPLLEKAIADCRDVLIAEKIVSALNNIGQKK